MVVIIIVVAAVIVMASAGTNQQQSTAATKASDSPDCRACLATRRGWCLATWWMKILMAPTYWVWWLTNCAGRGCGKPDEC